MLEVDKVIAEAFSEFGLKAPVIDIASGGNTCRGLCPIECLTLDIGEKTVDICADAHSLPLRNGVFGTVVCFESLEHLANPFKVFSEFGRVLKSEGLVYVTTVFMWSYHPHPTDYWRFTTECIEMLMRQAGLKPLHVSFFREARHFNGNPVKDHVIGVGTKNG